MYCRDHQTLESDYAPIKKKRERKYIHFEGEKNKKTSNFSHVSSIDWLFAEEESLLAQRYMKKIAQTSLTIREIKIKPKRLIG